MKSAPARWWTLLFSCALAALLLWLLVRGLDPQAFRQALSSLSFPLALAALGFLAAGYTTRIVRWWWMLKALEPELSLAVCVWPFLTSIALNNVLPFRVGDGLRIVGFRGQLRCPAVPLAGTLVVERLLDAVALCGFFFLGLLYLPSGVFPQPFVVAATVLAGASVGALLALMVALPLIYRWGLSVQKRLQGTGQRWRWLAAAWGQGLRLAETLSLIGSAPRMLVLLALSGLCWGLEGGVFATVAAALPLELSPVAPWFSLATGTLATLLPSTPGYAGTFDYFAAQGLAVYGTPAEAAAAFALTVHGLLWAPLTGSGLVYLLVRGVRR